MFKRESGFTLIELLVAIALVAIVVSIASPSYQTFVVGTRNSGAINATQGLVSYARSEAVKAREPVTICSSNDSASCAASNDYTNGWLVFIDRDADAAVDADDVVLKVGEALSSGSSMRLTGFNQGAGVVRFNSQGELQGGAAQSGTIILCPSDNDTTDARGVVVYLSGFARLAVDENGDDIVNGHTGGNVTCP